jgi:hypothetical protein
MIQRRGSGSNRRITVLQTEKDALKRLENRRGVDSSALCGSYPLWEAWTAFVRAAAAGDPTALARGLSFAESWAAAEEARVVAGREASR